VLCAALLLLGAAGCGQPAASPTPGLLSDPNEIVTKGVVGLGASTSVHIDGTLGGSIDAASLGTIGGGAMDGLSGTVKLDGSSLSGDVDLRNQAFHLTASFPRLFATTADVVAVDGFIYARASLFGDKYTRYEAPNSLQLPSALPLASPLPGKGWDLGDVFSRLIAVSGAQATLVGREKVGGGDAYHVAMTAPASTLDSLVAAVTGGAAGGPAIDRATLDFWVDVAMVRLVRLELKGGSASFGNVDLTLTLTRYDEPVTIAAPPDSEVQAG
jgi:hypothetical protein